MNRKLMLIVAASLVATQLWAQDKPAKKIELKTTNDKAAYALGAFAAMNLRQHLEMLGVEIDSATLQRGFRDAIEGGKLALSDEDMDDALKTQSEEVSKRNGEAGDKFLEGNKKKKDVVTLPSGLQYKILKKGTGKAPTVRDLITTNFRGRLLNGKEFANQANFTIPVADVIEGWKQALAVMPAGSKWELYIPPDLAFGPMGSGNIPPNATVVYELELLSVDKPTAGGPPAAGAPAPRGKPQLEDVK